MKTTVFAAVVAAMARSQVVWIADDSSPNEHCCFWYSEAEFQVDQSEQGMGFQTHRVTTCVNQDSQGNYVTTPYSFLTFEFDDTMESYKCGAKTAVTVCYSTFEWGDPNPNDDDYSYSYLCHWNENITSSVGLDVNPNYRQPNVASAVVMQPYLDPDVQCEQKFELYENENCTGSTISFSGDVNEQMLSEGVSVFRNDDGQPRFKSIKLPGQSRLDIYDEDNFVGNKYFSMNQKTYSEDEMNFNCHTFRGSSTIAENPTDVDKFIQRSIKFTGTGCPDVVPQ